MTLPSSAEPPSELPRTYHQRTFAFSLLANRSAASCARSTSHSSILQPIKRNHFYRTQWFHITIWAALLCGAEIYQVDDFAGVSVFSSSCRLPPLFRRFIHILTRTVTMTVPPNTDLDVSKAWGLLWILWGLGWRGTWVSFWVRRRVAIV